MRLQQTVKHQNIEDFSIQNFTLISNHNDINILYTNYVDNFAKKNRLTINQLKED